MAYTATVYNVMIASPSDVTQERQIVREVVHEWNAVNSKDKLMVLMPIGWETDASPTMGDRPQEIINEQLLQEADLLITVFWTRIGSPTGKAPSGTVEEIERHISAGKPAMLYFSSAPVRPDSIDPEQYNALCEFKKSCQSRGLIENYDSPDDFRRKLVRQLAQSVARNFRPTLPPEPAAPVPPPGVPAVPSLSEEAKQLLLEASQDRTGTVIRLRTSAGLRIQTNGRNFVEGRDPRSEAVWEGVLRELCDAGLLQDKGYKGEMYGVPREGYDVADLLRGG
jgi:hypothetical protein